MSFRDDHDAALARADALERENATLKAEVSRLRGEGGDVPPAVERDPRRWLLVGAAVASAVVLGGIALVLPTPELRAAFVATGALGTVTLLGLAMMLVTPGVGRLAILSGRQVGGRSFRVVTRPTVRIPIVENLTWLEAGPFAIERRMGSVYLRGGEPVAVNITASVRIHRERPEPAVERFLGVATEAIARTAGEFVEGHVRSVLAELRAEEVRRVELVRAAVLDATQRELDECGLALDHLTIVVEARQAAS